MSGRKPNFVIILADDLGYGDVGCYGSSTQNTPNIDHLAREGVRFTNFYANGPVCSPTRAAFVTGQYQQRCGVTGVIRAGDMRSADKGIRDRHVTFPRLLQDQGYRTAVFGKWHLGYDIENNPTRHGFDEFRGYVAGNVDYFSHVDQVGQYDWWNGEEQVQEDGYVTHLVTEHACRFIRENSDRPFCLYVAHEAPHYPYQGPNDSADRAVDGDFPTSGSRPDKKTAYVEMVTEMDNSVGAIRKELKAQGLEEDTLLVFFSDNGACDVGSNTPLRGGKGDVWEGGIRIPAVARWAGKTRDGAECDEPVIGMDLSATMLELAGARLPEGYRPDGVSLDPLLSGGRLDRRPLFWGFRDSVAVREGDRKLIMTKGQVDGLYDVVADIGETEDRAAEEPETVQRLAALIEEWQREVALPED